MNYNGIIKTKKGELSFIFIDSEEFKKFIKEADGEYVFTITDLPNDATDKQKKYVAFYLIPKLQAAYREDNNTNLSITEIGLMLIDKGLKINSKTFILEDILQFDKNQISLTIEILKETLSEFYKISL